PGNFAGGGADRALAEGKAFHNQADLWPVQPFARSRLGQAALIIAGLLQAFENFLAVGRAQRKKPLLAAQAVPAPMAAAMMKRTGPAATSPGVPAGSSASRPVTIGVTRLRRRMKR
ncbi:MAG: hypothetical protein RIQ46_828, partial [Pseudomonadota bacterium]